MAAVSNGSEYFRYGGDNRGDSFRRGKNEDAAMEEELMWAALSRLPSQKRSNMALMRRSASKSGGGRKRTETIDVSMLSRSGRELLVRNALATSEQDNFRLLSGIKERMDAAMEEEEEEELMWAALSRLSSQKGSNMALMRQSASKSRTIK